MSTGTSGNSMPPELHQALEALSTIDCSLQSWIGSGSLPSFHKTFDQDDFRLISTPALESLRSRATRLRRSRDRSSSKKLLLGRKSSFTVTSSMEPLKPRAHPSSLVEFHQRLRSYKLSSYPAGKPRGLSPPSMAANGWFNVQKNRLRCDACGSSWVLATPSKGDWSTNSGKQLAELGIRLRTDKHQVSCPWRSRRFPSSIYRATRWNTSTEAAKSLFRVAERFQSSVFHDGQPSIQLEHPLSNSDVTALTTAVSILLSSTLNKKPASNSTSTSTVSEQCLILALFGWDIKSLTTITLSSQLETCMSLRTSQTVAPSSLNQPTSKATDSNNNLNSTEELEIISCSLCHRQVIFSRLTQPFNVLTEHRDYCPNFDSRCGFEDLEPALTTWQILLGLIKKFIERQGGQPSTLEEVVERFKSLNQCKSPQTGVLNFVRDALTTSSISKLS